MAARATAVAAEARPTRNRKRFELVGVMELPLERVHPNPKNPRPKFHFDLGAADPGLAALGESIKTDGLHRPVYVYENLPDQPGEYILIQGHRRRAGSILAGLETIQALVVPKPLTPEDELEWLGVEEAFKLSWQGFFEMRHARDLARELRLPIKHPDIAMKTGFKMDVLATAEKVFQLEPEIQALIVEYERIMYMQHVSGQRKVGGRMAGSGVRSQEFTPTKAALVWDIFKALRENCTSAVKTYDDVTLQQKVAGWATSGTASASDLEALLAQIRQAGKSPQLGLLTQIHDLLENETKSVKAVVRATGASHATKLTKLVSQAAIIEKNASELLARVTQIGSDPEALQAASRQLLATTRELNDLEREITNRVRQLERKAL